MKSILVAILVPAAFALAGFGASTPAAAGGGTSVPLPPVGSTCATVLCSAGSVCVDTKTGPICVPDPSGPTDS